MLECLCERLMFIDKVNNQRGADAYKITMTLETEEMSARNSIDIIFIIFRRIYFDAFFSCSC